MNKTRLNVIFKKYIENFEMINNEKNDETYKWEIAQEFQNFDVNANDFSEMLTQMWKTSANLIDNSQQLPFYALVDYSHKEPETVRQMFKKLYKNEHCDDIEKQQIINEFIAESEKLREKYYPESRLYVNNQRAVMMYLFLRYPESNFGYKASQAKSFADCIEFYDDWGPMTDFKLDVFSRMCKEIIEEIKQNEALLTTHKSRFENTNRKLHPDNNLHILTLDIIFSSQAYNFYDGMTYDPINAKSRKLHLERAAKAKELAAVVEKAKSDFDMLQEAKCYITDVLKPGEVVYYNRNTEGKVIENDGSLISIELADKTVKKLGISAVLNNGLLTFDSDEIEQKLKSYLPILKNEYQIPRTLERASNELQPYMEYLD